MIAVRTLVLLAAAALLAGCGADDKTSLPQGSEPANLDPADFVDTIDHPYWPMQPGMTWVYSDRDLDGSKQRVVVTVTDETKEISGIPARIVHDVVTEDGAVVEDTYDWYAQDKDGNLWYLGEDTKEYEDGKVASTAGSWQAGVDGAEPGIILPAKPSVGMAYRQEYYKGEAEDSAEVLSLDEWTEVPAGAYKHLLMTKEFTALEPDVLEHKFYARGVGPVLGLSVSGGTGREELIELKGP
jgi:major membrane immunogen (membrane-anchored lipoprotein)